MVLRAYAHPLDVNSCFVIYLAMFNLMPSLTLAVSLHLGGGGVGGVSDSSYTEPGVDVSFCM